MKKRILIVHNYYQILGGEDTVVANEKKMLEEHGHTVFLYTRNNSEINKMNIFRKMFLPFTTIYNPRTAKDIKKNHQRTTYRYYSCAQYIEFNQSCSVLCG